MINIDIIDYMGKFHEGVFVLLSIGVDGEFSEGTLFYTKDDVRLTVDSIVEEKIGCSIEEHPDYMTILEKILRKCVPYEEIITRLDDINFDNYVDTSLLSEDYLESEEIDSNEIKTSEDEDK